MEHLEQWFREHVAPTSPYPIGITVERAEGLYFYDDQGKRYLDLVAGIAVNNIGHRHPAVIKAIQEQVQRYLHVMVYGELVQAPQATLAKQLADLLPAPLNMTYLVNSGTEANEAALKLAKRATGRTELIACRGAYHGSTHGSLSVSGNETKKFAFRPLLPDVRFIPFNAAEDLKQITHRTAAVIVETVQGDAGVRIPDPAYLQALRQRCTETGALLIMDEIQCGMGRTGTLFAFEQFGIVPDLLTLGKALGGGMPIGALCASKELLELFTERPMLGHITTFGGHPVNSAAAAATLSVLAEPGFLDPVAANGRLFQSLLDHPAIREVRQIGLMLAVDLESPEMVQHVFTYCLERGIVGFWFLSCPASFRIAPPLTITKTVIREACQVILES
ncbi:MAG: aspartate aminotransferase family protein, partial [Bacteroidota bacterium]